MLMLKKVLFLVFFLLTVLNANTFDINKTDILKTQEIYKYGKKVKELLNPKITDLNKINKKEQIVSTVFMQKGEKVIAFINAKAFKKGTNLGKNILLKNVTNKDVVMIVYNGGTIIYKVFNGENIYKDVSKILIQGFSMGVASFTPPPINFIVKVGTEELLTFAVKKYEELDERNYVEIKDMLWDVPDEIKNKITSLNMEDIDKETIFDFGDIEKETILDNEVSAKSSFDENEDGKKTILDY